ncbi:MAG: ribonuclease J [Saccharofermentans sp.]|jgi:ribonuclease J|nr:ribonuclease J [Mageeibacillus sp.]MCI1264752.1 ribonuclease J [Saccharofermentans sp.]MCI1274579.1 ribonuclease J [Saccharofermentans sp.]MCI2043865.1 ribonuclease J [Mageeibacillus sp.]
MQQENQNNQNNQNRRSSQSNQRAGQYQKRRTGQNTNPDKDKGRNRSVGSSQSLSRRGRPQSRGTDSSGSGSSSDFGRASGHLQVRNQGMNIAPAGNAGTVRETGRRPQHGRANGASRTKDLKIIPLGGLSEIGKNMTAFEYGNDMIIVDVGMSFPEENMPGIDCVIPDFTYVRDNISKLRGIVLTHGHEDHIGSLPFFLREFKCPIYSGTLTIELVRHKLEEERVGLEGIRLEKCKNGDKIKLGNSFEVEFIRVNHSIADSYAIALRTPVGVIVHSGDFKIDFTPINGKTINLQRFGELGLEGVLMFMCESTNVEIDGFSPSEKQVGESFKQLFRKAQGRIIVATFSSHIHRMQQIISAAEQYGRHVCLSGRSMVSVFAIANSLGYIDMKPETLIDLDSIDNYDDDKIVILTTGSQAEPMSALTRMAFDSHRSVDIKKGDTIIISANPIPGNEKPIYRVINELYKKGAHVIYQSLAHVHVSGHAYRNELMMLHTLLKPKFFIPVHGEYRMLCIHKEIAMSLGMPEDNIFILGNGDVLSLNADSARITDHVPASAVLVDGSGTMGAEDQVLNDRIHLSEDGCISVGLTISDDTGELCCEPSVNSIGCFDGDENIRVIHSAIARKCAAIIASNASKQSSLNAFVEKRAFREQVKNFVSSKTGRRPMIICNVSHISSRGDNNYYGDT